MGCGDSIWLGEMGLSGTQGIQVKYVDYEACIVVYVRNYSTESLRKNAKKIQTAILLAILL